LEGGGNSAFQILGEIMFIGVGGTTTLNASAYLDSSTDPVRVYSIGWASGAAAGVVNLLDGITSTSAIRWTDSGSANSMEFQDFGEIGIRFENGCYVAFDDRTTLAIVSWHLEK
jgi:hypothetical protein